MADDTTRASSSPYTRPKRRPALRLVGLLAIELAAITGLVACDRSPDKDNVCRDRRKLARAALERNDLDDARRLLEDARARCGPAAASKLESIEAAIVEKAEQRQSTDASVESEDRGQTEIAVERFIRWATERGELVTDKVAEVHCVERGKPDFGFCEAQHPDSSEMTVRYFKDDRQAFRYQLATREPLSCQDLGAHRVVKKWKRGDAAFELCELEERELRSVSALLVESPPENKMFVFSDKYLLKDEEFTRYSR